jgi:hypothetical protein
MYTVCCDRLIGYGALAGFSRIRGVRARGRAFLSLVCARPLWSLLFAPSTLAMLTIAGVKSY